MTVTTTTTTETYAGNGITTVFSFSYYAFVGTVRVFVTTAGNKIEVFDTTNAYNTDQSSNPGGTVTFATAPAAGTTIELVRDTPETQTTNYQNYDAFPADTHELALDKLTLIAQELNVDMGTDPNPILNTIRLLNTIDPVQWGNVTINFGEISGSPVVTMNPDAEKTAAFFITTDIRAASLKAFFFGIDGRLTLPAGVTPTQDDHAASKQYVDQQVAGGGSSDPNFNSVGINAVGYTGDIISVVSTEVVGEPTLLWNPTANTVNNDISYGWNVRLGGVQKSIAFLSDGSVAIDAAVIPTLANQLIPKGYADANYVPATGDTSIAGIKTFSGTTTQVESLTAIGPIASGTLTSNGNLVSISANGILVNGPAPSSFAASVHTHSASQITSGTLAVTRGGTGTTTSTGSGANVRAGSPTLTGTVNAAAVSATGNFASTTLAPAGPLYAGNFGVITVTNPSDRDLKESIRDIETGLDEILQLHPVRHGWIDKEAYGEGEKYGFIAQEAGPIFPLLATIENGEHRTFNDVGLIPSLVKSIHELQAQIDELRKELRG